MFFVYHIIFECKGLRYSYSVISNFHYLRLSFLVLFIMTKTTEIVSSMEF